MNCRNVLGLFTLERLVTLVGIMGHMATYIQGFKIMVLKSSYAVSLPAYLIGFVSIVFWLIYGFSKNIKPLIISNIFGMIGSLLVIGLILYYYKNL